MATHLTGSRSLSTPWTLACLGVVTAVGLLDVLTVNEVVFVGLLIAGPLLATAFLDARRTIMVGLYAVAWALALTNHHRHDLTGSEQVTRIVTVVAMSGLAAWVAHHRHMRDVELDQAREIASVTQRAILHAVPSEIGRVRFAARYRSASHGAVVGGDFYDVVPVDSRVRAVIGDVQGHGLDALPLASVVLGVFRGSARTASTLVDAVEAVVQAVPAYLAPEELVTFAAVEIGDDDVVRVVNVGHHAPLLIREGAAEFLEPSSRTRPLGLDPAPVQDEFALRAGDRVLLYTDGFCEARRADGEMIEAERVAAAALSYGSLEDGLDAVCDAITDFAGGPVDDVGMLVIELVQCGPDAEAFRKRQGDGLR